MPFKHTPFSCASVRRGSIYTYPSKISFSFVLDPRTALVEALPAFCSSSGP